MSDNDKKYEELIGKYEEYRKERNRYDNLMKEISNELDRLMHLDNLNEKNVYITVLNEEFNIKYVDRINKSVDYQLLAETVSSALYNEFVTEKKSTYLKISKLPKVKENKKERPVSIEENPIKAKAPVGVLFK